MAARAGERGREIQGTVVCETDRERGEREKARERTQGEGDRETGHTGKERDIQASVVGVACFPDE